MRRTYLQRWMTPAEILPLLRKAGIRCAERTIEYWCATGRLPATKSIGGGQWHIDLRELKTFSRETRDVYEELVSMVAAE